MNLGWGAQIFRWQEMPFLITEWLTVLADAGWRQTQTEFLSLVKRCWTFLDPRQWELLPFQKTSSSVGTASSQWFDFRPYLWDSWYNLGHVMGSCKWLVPLLTHSPRHTSLTGTRIEAHCTFWEECPVFWWFNSYFTSTVDINSLCRHFWNCVALNMGFDSCFWQ